MHLIRNRRLLNSKIFVILLVVFVWLIADNLLEFVFPTYLEKAGKSYAEIGVLLSVISISGLLIDLPMGALSDRASRKTLMISGLVLAIISTILIFSFKGDILLAAAFLFWGLAYQAWKVPKDAYFASLTKKDHRATSYGFEAEVKYGGQTIGPLIGGFVLTYLGFAGIISFYVVFLIIAIFILFIFVKETNHRPMMHALSKSGKFSTLLKEVKNLRMFGFLGVLLLYLALLFTIWEEVLFVFEPLFYGPDVLNLSPKMGGVLLACFSLPGLFLSAPFGKLADKVGKKTILVTGLLIIGLSLLVFSRSSSLFIVFALALLISIGWVLSMVALNALIVDLSYDHKKGEIVGLWNFFMDIGFVIGPLIGGLIAEVWGVRNVFLTIGVVFLASSLLMLMVSHKILATNTKLSQL